MNKQQFETYLKDPASLSQASLDQLEKVIADFPYCQVAHILYVRNLYQQGSIHFNQKLKVAAAYAGNRSLLKKLVQSTPVHPEPVQSPYAGSPERATAEHSPIRKESENKAADSYGKKTIGTTDENALGIDGIYIERKKEDNKGKTKKELIERFIEEEPSITSPKKHHFYKVTEAAERSLADHDDLFSETLARIYLKQGNAEKAKRIYQQLMLKFPEKSSYFAAQLKKLDKSE